MSIDQTAISAHPKRGPMRGAARFFNRFVLPFAGTRVMPLYGVLTHRGRRSGKLFRTPIVARPTSDGFVIPMPWGEGTDWFRNVRAAGACTLRWKGRDYPLTGPELIQDAGSAPGFTPFQRRMMTRFGIKVAVRLRHVG